MRPAPEFPGDSGMPMGGVASWYYAYRNSGPMGMDTNMKPGKGYWRAGRVVSGEDEGQDFVGGYLATKYFRELLLWVLDETESLDGEEYDKVFAVAKNVAVVEQGSSTKYQEREFTVGDTTYYLRYTGELA